MYTKIKTFEDACKDQGLDPAVTPDVSMLPAGLQKFLLAAFMLSIITVSVNKDDDGKEWKANWNDTDQYKYLPWFDVKASKKNPSGSGLSCSGFGYVRSVAGVASRLLYRDSDRAKYSANQFKDLWEDYILHRD